MKIKALWKQVLRRHIEGGSEGGCRAWSWPPQARFEIMEAGHSDRDIPRSVLDPQLLTPLNKL